LVALTPYGTERWEAPLHPLPTSPAIAADGTIVVSTTEGQGDLQAFYPDGRWRWNAGANNAPIIGADGAIYACLGLDLVAYDLRGARKWLAPSVGCAGPSIGADGTIYSTGDALLFATLPDGTTGWQSDANLGGAVGAASIAPDGTIHVFGVDGRLYAFAPDGTKKWSVMLGPPDLPAYFPNVRIAGPAIATDGTVYVLGAGNYLFAVGPDGSTKWSLPTGYGFEDASAAIGGDGTIYVSTWNHPDSGDSGAPDASLPGSESASALYAIAPDGTMRWFLTFLNHMQGVAIGADGTLYVGGDDGHLHAIGD
jgi:outer membrane protein assembly factor BamB